MEEEKTVSSSPDGYNVGILMITCMILSWLFIHRWSQRNKKCPKTWPLVGAAIEQLMNYEQMHDWLVKYLSQLRTVVVPMPFTTYTYIAHPANVEHVLKTNFANYPKVQPSTFTINIDLKHQLFGLSHSGHILLSLSDSMHFLPVILPF